LPVGGGNARDDRLENVGDPGPFLCAREDRAAAVEADDVLELAFALFRLRARQIDLVDDRNDLEIVVDRKVGIGEGLRFNTLRRVNQEQRAFARRERSRDLVTEVDVAGRDRSD
jgi:hypothetical protein